MPSSRHIDRLALADYALPASITKRLFSPALVVFLDHVRANVQQMLEYLGGEPTRWRPHVKTTKTPVIWRELVNAGVRHFKCATPREAEWLVKLLLEMAVEGADVLVAYPLLSPNIDKIERLAKAHPGVRLSVLSEAPAHAASVPADLGVFIDINPHMNRTGIPMADRAGIEAVARAAGSRFRGLHFYDGHVRDDEAAVRQEPCWELYRELLSIEASLRKAGIVGGELITSGTPAFPYALSFDGFKELDNAVHRSSPGTVVFHDMFTDDLMEDVELRRAALLFTRVISHPTADVATCDAGSKSLAAEAGDAAAYVLGHPGLVAQSPSEERLPLRVVDGDLPPRGTELLLVPRHVCPTVNLAETLLLVERDQQARVVEVAARAHDLLAPEA